MKYSTLKVDKEEYRLGYDFNGLCDAEALTGCNLLTAMRDLGEASAGQLRGLLFAAIRAVPYEGMPGSAELLKQCGDLLRADTIGPVILALGHTYALGVSQEYAAKFEAALMTPAPPAAPEAQQQPE